jgi:hypothetical protein
VVARPLVWALLTAAGVAAVACDRPGRPGRATNADPVDPAVAQLVFGVGHNVTVGGIRRAALRADTALFGDSATSIELRGVRLILYSPGRDSVGVVTAPAATYDLRARRLTARGGVTLLVARRRTSAPGAVYDAATSKVTEAGGRAVARSGSRAAGR